MKHWGGSRIWPTGGGDGGAATHVRRSGECTVVEMVYSGALRSKRVFRPLTDAEFDVLVYMIHCTNALKRPLCAVLCITDFTSLSISE